jgi:hypothetical protein
MIMLYLDNVTIEGLTVGTSVASARFSRIMATNMPVVATATFSTRFRAQALAR